MELSEYERSTLSKDLVRRIKGLSKAHKSTKVAVAIKILDEGRRQGVTGLIIYRAVLKVFGVSGTLSEENVKLSTIHNNLQQARLENNPIAP